MMSPADFAEQADQQLAGQDVVRALAPFVPPAPAPLPAPVPAPEFAPPEIQMTPVPFIEQIEATVSSPQGQGPPVQSAVVTRPLVVAAQGGYWIGRSLGLSSGAVRTTGAVAVSVVGGAVAAGVGAALTAGAKSLAEVADPDVFQRIYGSLGGQSMAGTDLQQYQPGASVFTMQRGAAVPMGAFVTKVWTNPYTGLKGAKLSDGRMVAQRKDGSLKVYRPEKPIVVTRNPRLRSFVRAEERLHKLGKRMKKVLK